MSCCGEKRQSLKRSRMSVTPDPAPSRPPRLIYDADSDALMRGAHTGRNYWFSRERREQDVDPRDLPSLVATGLFRQA